MTWTGSSLVVRSMAKVGMTEGLVSGGFHHGQQTKVVRTLTWTGAEKKERELMAYEMVEAGDCETGEAGEMISQDVEFALGLPSTIAWRIRNH